MSQTDNKESRPRGRCPICQGPTEQAFTPFCSSRCADIDLSRWLRGAYAIPVQGGDDDEDGDEAGPQDGDGPGQPRGKPL
jgi:endogenous inhibitor of DNA gyrase (YacG/DUF329 family)